MHASIASLVQHGPRQQKTEADPAAKMRVQAAQASNMRVG